MPTIPNALVPIFFCWHHPFSQISRFQGGDNHTLLSLSPLRKITFQVSIHEVLCCIFKLEKVLITQMAVMCLAGHPGFPGKK